jgi:hypothetical protein
MSLKEDLRDYLRRDHVSFAELSRLEGFKGDLAIELPVAGGAPFLIWAGISRAAADALQELVAEGFCHYQGCSPLIYMIDGVMSSMPVARQNRGYKKQRWLPLVVKLGPAKRGRHRPRG